MIKGMKAPLAPRDGFPCLPLFWFRQTIYWITQLWCTSCFNSLPTKFNPISARKDRLLFIHQIVSKKGIEKKCRVVYQFRTCAGEGWNSGYSVVGNDDKLLCINLLYGSYVVFQKYRSSTKLFLYSNTTDPTFP